MAPVTSQHILKLAKLGAYNTVNFFRVDKGFVAQTADVVYGRMESAPLDVRQTVCLTLWDLLQSHLMTASHAGRSVLTVPWHKPAYILGLL